MSQAYTSRRKLAAFSLARGYTAIYTAIYILQFIDSIQMGCQTSLFTS